MLTGVPLANRLPAPSLAVTTIFGVRSGVDGNSASLPLNFKPPEPKVTVGGVNKSWKVAAGDAPLTLPARSVILAVIGPAPWASAAEVIVATPLVSATVSPTVAAPEYNCTKD